MTVLHPVIIKFTYKTEDFDYLDDLEEQIEQVVTYHKVGKYDTYELDEENNRAVFFLSAHDPKILFKNVRPILEESPILKGAKIEVEMGRTQDGTPILKEYQL